MITIEEEIEHVIQFLSHPCGFEVSLYAVLSMRPISEDINPSNWEVTWIEVLDGLEIESYKEFSSLQEAAQFFVEKRRYMLLGADFENIKDNIDE
jgi:hypothetical protein